MKRIFCLILVLLFPLMLASCAPEGMTPVETVQYYFKQWNAKNWTAMDSVVIDKMKSGPEEGLIYVELLKCQEETDKSRIDFEPEWYDKTPYKVALVYADFDIKYDENAMTGFDNGEQDGYSFYLVKDGADSDWKIASWGYA